MPATVMITTQERTALDELTGPLTASFNSAFRQKWPVHAAVCSPRWTGTAAARVLA